MRWMGLLVGVVCLAATLAIAAEIPGAERLEITSTADGTSQPSWFVAAKGDAPRPMLVFLHAWSSSLDTFDYTPWPTLAAERNWHILMPNFRGPNHTPEACGSALARQDVLDSVDAVCRTRAIDTKRVFLAGTSGGGHMAMVMAGHAPERWAGVSAWVGISDVAAWHAETKAADRKYYKDIEKVVGGAPGSGEAIEADLRYRSPVHHLAAAKDVPLDLCAGVHDGHTGSVPIHHTLDAFNAVARARGEAEISDEVIRDLSARKLDAYQDTGLTIADRQVYLRREAGPCRVTIFEGGHEHLPSAAMAWFDGLLEPHD